MSAVRARRRRRAAPPSREPRRSDLRARVLYAVPAIAFAVFIVGNGGWIFALGLIALGIACLHELYEMLAGTRPVKLAGFLALTGLVLAAHFGHPFQILLVAVIAVPLVFVLTVARPLDAAPTPAIATTLLGVYWIGFAVAHAMLLRDLPHGDAIVIDVLAGTFIGDTGAYLGGRALGRRPLAPRISPNKTVEGLVIGMVCAVLAVLFASTYQDWLPTGKALLIGIAVALAAPLGDLFESLIKRDAGTKDTGRLFGAHGGALDRLDAALFTLVAGYYVWVGLLPG